MFLIAWIHNDRYIFIVNCLKDIAKSQKKKLYCTLVDCKQAFDRVWRDCLWANFYSFRMNRKCLNVIKSIYENSKSRIITAEGPSAFLSCNIEFRQGDNVYPLLFTVFLNDLEQYLEQHTHGINADNIDDDTSVLF